ncbi:glycosyltransferase family 4 protein [Bacteroides graminisolvens]|uniref:MraY family glycosyltransferase n=1 Tax=Bacteroides graminisolvens TaxID=477666 RepID=UPI0023F4C5B3|nr:glycosyltransferase family 4 protein [Bacteroides graminisolvens]
MDMYLINGIIFAVLLVVELAYFKIADKYNIIDKPNERSSHSTIVLRGGGIIFTLSMLAWVGLQGVYGDWSPVVEYLPFLIGLFLIAGVSFVDDVVSLPDSVRLVTQFTAMALMFWNLGIMHWEMWWMVVIALIVCVGATNVINFMDGINGITAGYSLAVLGPLAIINIKSEFIDQNFLITIILGVLVFCFFNFRPKGKAKCFAGDVGSIGIAFILLFAIGKLIIQTGDVTYLLFLLVYGVDGCLTICHRIKLHENLGEAHRKHVYQLMANELKIGHVKVSVLYMVLQLVISLGLIYGVPDTVTAHWVYLVICLVVLGVAYIWFKRKYYHLHEEYLASLKK